jgi:hypothetical protein
MRNHLRECLLLKKVKRFPVLKSTIKCKNWRPKKIASFDLFCKCQRPWYDSDCVVEKYKLLVVCKTCKLSFHDGCEKIPKKALKSTKVDWICSNCKKKLIFSVYSNFQSTAYQDVNPKIQSSNFFNL